VKYLQKASHNDLALMDTGEKVQDSVSLLMEAFFRLEATNSKESQKAQQRDFQLFLDFMFEELGNDERIQWSPRLSSDFKKHLQATQCGSKRRWSDRTINRVLVHLKRVSKWIHKLRPRISHFFPRYFFRKSVMLTMATCLSSFVPQINARWILVGSSLRDGTSTIPVKTLTISATG